MHFYRIIGLSRIDHWSFCYIFLATLYKFSDTQVYANLTNGRNQSLAMSKRKSRYVLCRFVTGDRSALNRISNKSRRNYSFYVDGSFISLVRQGTERQRFWWRIHWRCRGRRVSRHRVPAIRAWSCRPFLRRRSCRCLRQDSWTPPISSCISAEMKQEDTERRMSGDYSGFFANPNRIWVSFEGL